MVELLEYSPRSLLCATGEIGPVEGVEYRLSYSQLGLSRTPVLEEIIPHSLALLLPDGAGNSHHLLPAGALLPELPAGVASHLPFLCHLHHLLLLEPHKEAVPRDGIPQTGPGTPLLDLSGEMMKCLPGYSRHRVRCEGFSPSVLVRNRK